MSDTPRTDAAAVSIDAADGRGIEITKSPSGEFVYVEFAEQLERELQGANTVIAAYRQSVESLKAALKDAETRCAELDRLRPAIAVKID